MENKKSRVFAIVMLVILGVLSGCFIGAWFTSYDNQMSCSADVNISNATFNSSDLAFYGFGYRTVSGADTYSFNSLTTWSSDNWANTLKFKIDSAVTSIQRSNVNGEIQSCNLEFKLYLNCLNQKCNFGDYSTSNYDFVCVSSFRVNVQFVWQTNYLNFGKVSSYTITQSSGALVPHYSISDGSIYSFNTFRSSVTSTINNSSSYLFVDFASRVQIDTDYFLNSFTSDMINSCFFNSCSIGNYSAYSPFDGHLSGFYNWITFNDSTYGFQFSYAIPVEYNSSLNTITSRPMLYYSYRTYYYNQYQVGTENDYYKQGFEDGKQEGVQEGLNTGYTEGVADGRTAGYNEGFNAGVLDSNNYSFLGLMGAVVDAPIQAFTGLFNFEILGVNMKDFLAGLFTICLVIVVVRFVLVK